MNSKSAGIYSITSKINGKRYIGSSIRISDRWIEHKKQLKSNTHHSKYLQNHYNKYGENDLLFDVIEIMERGELSLKDFKCLLLEREQTYLDNWEECHFNSMKRANSTLGYKYPKTKNYSYYSSRDEYRVYYFVDGVNLTLGSFKTEQEAIDKVSFIKSLSDQEILKYWETNHKGKNSTNKYNKGKNYSFHKLKGVFRVYFTLDRKQYEVGYHEEEEDAIAQAEYLKTLSSEQKLNYYKNKPSTKSTKINCRQKGKKYYSYQTRTGKWRVQFYVNGKSKFYGNYSTEMEAQAKVKEVKKELGGFE